MRCAEGTIASPEENSGDFVLSGVQEDRGPVWGYAGFRIRKQREMSRIG